MFHTYGHLKVCQEILEIQSVGASVSSTCSIRMCKWESPIPGVDKMKVFILFRYSVLLTSLRVTMVLVKQLLTPDNEGMP